MTGIYPVILQAHNAGGYNSTRKTGYITVTGESAITDVYPKSVTKNTSSTYLTIYGQNFTSPLKVELRKQGITVASAKSVVVSLSSTIITTFDLIQVPVDIYDIAVIWADGTQKIKQNAVSVSALPNGVIFQNTDMKLSPGQTVSYSFTVPPTTPDLFITLQKVQYPGDPHTSWDGTITVSHDNQVIATSQSSQDQLQHIINPVPGNYTLTITAYQRGIGIVEVGTSLPTFPDGNWIVAPIYRPYGSTFHQIEIPAGKSSLTFNAEAMGTYSRFRVFRGQWENVTSQQWISSSGPGASLSIPSPQAGLYVVEFMDTQAITGGSQAREVLLKASTTGQVTPPPTYLPVIAAYTPKSGGNTGGITAEINGAWLEPNATVMLVGSGGSNISAYAVNGSAGKTLLEASFSLLGKTPGQYTLTVTNPDGQTITSSVPFTIEQGGRSELWTEITGRETIRLGRPATYIIRYGNNGNLDMPAPVLSVATNPPSNAIFVRFLPSNDWHPMNGAVSVVARGPADNPNVLPAGYSSSIEIEARTNQMSNFALVLLAYGGDPVFTPGTVESTVDASVPAPGISLVFDRSYPGSYSSYAGPFGSGWVHSYDLRLDQFADGTIGLRKGDGIITLLLYRGDHIYSAEGGYPVLWRATDSSSVLTMRDGSTVGFGTNQKPSSFADTNGNRITLSYNNAGQLKGIQHSDGDQFILDYGSDGRIIKLTDQAGKITTYAYNPDNSLLASVTQSDSSVTTYSYDKISNTCALASVTYPGGITRNFRFDGDGHLAETSLNNDKEAIQFSYDELERTTTAEDTTGSFVHIKVNENRQVLKTENAAVASQEFTYDQNNDLVDGSDALGNSFHMAYDKEHNVKEITDALGNKIYLTYESGFNALNSLTDPRGNVMNFTYDSRGNTIGITFPDSRTESMVYDPVGNPIQTTTRKGEVFNFHYNDRAQRTRIDYPDGSFAAFAYDTSGNLISASNQNGTITLEHNAHNQLTKILFPDGNSFSYTYDNAGRLTQRMEKDGYSEIYGYDDLGNLIWVSDGNMSVIARYAYDSAGKLQRKEVRNGGYTTYTYENCSQISRLVNYNATGFVLSRFDYQYDTAGNPVSINTLEGMSRYGYDALGQLVNVTSPDGIVTRYSYDAAGNRISVVDEGITTSYTTNVMNQYTLVGNASFTYDANGNLIRKKEGINTTTYDYNYDNRLIRVTSPEGVYEYTYDALGNRAGVTHNGILTRYSVDPLGIGDVVAEYNGNGSLIARYTHGLGLLSKVDSSGSEYYYSFNPTGHTTGITDSSGKIMNQYQYTPFGEYRQKSETIHNPFTYVGEYGVMDDGNGLLYMRLRHYSTHLGRFVSEDNLIFRDYDFHPYKYSRNNPISYIDPIGTTSSRWEDVGWGALRLLGGGMALVAIGTTTLVTSPVLITAVAVNGAFAVFSGASQASCGYLGVNNPFSEAGGIAEAGLGYAGGETGKQVGWCIDQGLGLATADWSKYSKIIPYTKIQKIPGLLKKVFNDIPNNWNRNPNPNTDQMLKPNPAITESQKVSPRMSVDPEDKYGPTGYDSPGTPSGSRSNYISLDTPLEYRVDFWNAENATANVCDVDAYDQMDTDLNWSTFRFTEIGFTNWSMPLEPTQYFNVYVDTRPSMPYIVQIEGLYNPATGRANLTYYTLNATTLQTPDDPLAGFLPPISASGKEVGWFTYTIDANAGLSSSTVIENRAWVNFDYSQFMPAPKDAPWNNTIDIGKPSSIVMATLRNQTEIVLEWTGTDDAGGSGIKDYTIFVSTDAGPYQPWLNHMTGTSVVMNGVPGQTYALYSIARDNVGNVEDTPSSPDTTITVPSLASPAFTAYPVSGPAPLNVQFYDISTGTGITAYQWILSDSATVYTTQNLTHTFTKPGNYQVSHSATNSGGTFWKNETNYITVTSPGGAPVAAFTATPTSGTAPFVVQFTDTSTGVPTSWNWSFGDGSVASVQNPVHTYLTAGYFDVSLGITNPFGVNTTSRAGYIQGNHIVSPYVPNSSSSSIFDFIVNTTGNEVNYTYSGNRIVLANITGFRQIIVGTNGVDLGGGNISGNVSSVIFSLEPVLTNLEGQLVTVIANVTKSTWNTTCNFTIDVALTTTAQDVDYKTHLPDGAIGYNPFAVLNITTSGEGATGAILNISIPYTWYANYTDSPDNTQGKNFTYVMWTHGSPVTTTPLTPVWGPDDPPKKWFTVTTPGLSPFGMIGATAKSSSPPGPNPGPGGGGGGGGGSGTYTGKIVQFGVPAKPGLTEAAVTIVTPITGTGIAESGSVVADLAGLEGVSAAWSIDVTQQPDANTTITTSIIQEPGSAVQDAFRTALRAAKMDIAQIAYVMQVTKSGISSTGPATVSLSIPQNWVNNYGGMDAVRIVRLGEDGSTEVLATTFSNYDMNTGYLTFKAPSPKGLSVFGLVAVKTYVPGAVTPAVIPQVTPSGADIPVQPSSVQLTSGGLPSTTIIGAVIVILVIIGIGIHFYTRKHD